MEEQSIKILKCHSAVSYHIQKARNMSKLFVEPPYIPPFPPTKVKEIMAHKTMGKQGKKRGGGGDLKNFAN